MKNYLWCFCLLLTACSNLPPAIEDAPPYNLGYQEALTSTSNFKNAPVRWGGVIVEVENEQNASYLQILFYPLSSFGRPQIDEANEGRFVIKSTEFLDPAIYTKNTSITVAGILAGDIERTIGKKTLRLPLITPSHPIHLWPTQLESQYNRGSIGFGYGINSFGVYPYMYQPYYRPFMGYPRGW